MQINARLRVLLGTGDWGGLDLSFDEFSRNRNSTINATFVGLLASSSIMVRAASEQNKQFVGRAQRPFQLGSDVATCSRCSRTTLSLRALASHLNL